MLIACKGSTPPSPPPPPPPAAPPADAAVPVDAAAPQATVNQPCPGSDEPSGEPEHDTLTLTRATFADLPDWKSDHHAQAVPALVRSCEKIAALKDTDPVGSDGHGGVAKQWRRVCAAAARLKAGDDAAARAMFEAEFTPYAAAGKTGPDGKLTGYNVTEVHSSRTRHGKFQTPVFGRPKDLVMIDLALHIRDAHGRRIWGMVDSKGEVVPYATRAEIRKGALAGKNLELMYLDDPVDLLFAQIEGSAKAILDDGKTVWLEFAGKNGRAYKGVGGVLKAMGELRAPGSGTMQGIRKWFADHPGRYDEVVDQVASYVFFKESAQPGAVGTQMVILTPQRSAAVDRAFIALGTPIWVDTKAPIPNATGSAPFRQLLIAQDTGAGIQGAVRADIYWGDDADAADRGGRMGTSGRYWVLLPNGVTK